MRATIRRAVEAHKAQREENGEAGFSLIELIIVVVILGILAAIAIPIFLNVQQDARNNAASSVAANAATQAAAQMSSSVATERTNDAIQTKLTSNFKKGDVTAVTLAATAEKIDTICVTVTYTGVTDTKFLKSGPGCTTTP
nr:type II secretion system protein [uncultured Microbacterium sp.]